jgi:hypothetical protein
MLTLRQSRRFLGRLTFACTFPRPRLLALSSSPFMVTFRSPRMAPVRTIRSPIIFRRSKNARTLFAFWAIHARVTRWNLRYVFIFRRSRTLVLVRAPVYLTPFSVHTRPPFEQSEHTVLSARMPAPYVRAFRHSRTFALSSDSQVLTQLLPVGGHPRLRSRQSLRAHCCRNVRAPTHLTMCKLAIRCARSSSTYCHQDSLASPSPDLPPCSSF